MNSDFSCNRRMFLLGTATTFAGALLAACGGKNSDEVKTQATDVPVGSAIIVGNYIIAQPTAGEYKAYSTTCPHANGVINKVDGDIVICSKHGSEFSIADGAVVEGPATTGLTEKPVTVDGGTIDVQ